MSEELRGRRLGDMGIHGHSRGRKKMDRISRAKEEAVNSNKRRKSKDKKKDEKTCEVKYPCSIRITLKHENNESS